MKPFILAATLLAIGPGCTAVHESLVPHRDLTSPCACLDEAVPINDPAFLETLVRKTV